METIDPFSEQAVAKRLQVDLLKRNWELVVNDSAFKAQSALTFAFAFVIIYFIPNFFIHIQARSGTALHDPVLDFLPALDVSRYIFLILYGCTAICVGYLIYFPKQFIWGVQAYCVMTVLRVLTVYFVPLEPHQALIPLNDPFINQLFYKGQFVSKDLFFSGHTATVFILALVVNNKSLKIFFMLATLFIGALILTQHVHYSYDVFAAPFFAWLSCALVQGAGFIWRMAISNKLV